jgi:hypothetical protein
MSESESQASKYNLRKRKSDIVYDEESDDEDDQKIPIMIIPSFGNKGPQQSKHATIKKWLNGSKRSKYTRIAEQIYDKVNYEPKEIEIIRSKMPLREKCNMIEQLKIMRYIGPDTQMYFSIKNNITKTLESYENIEYSSRRIKKLEKIENDLMKDIDIPLRIQILTANISKRNKAIILRKYQECEESSIYEMEKHKTWIKWALCVTEDKISIPVSLDDGSAAINEYLSNVKRYMDEHVYKMNTVKNSLLEILAGKITNRSSRETSIGLLGPPGVGKCLDPNEEVLLYNCGWRYAKDIRIGDALIDDENDVRFVNSTIVGEDIMYNIKIENGYKFRCNSCHELTLYDIKRKVIYDIPINKYMEMQNKSDQRFITRIVEYGKKPYKIDPNMAGIFFLPAWNKTYDEDQIVSIAGELKEYERQSINYIISTCNIPNEFLYNTIEIRDKFARSILYSAIIYDVLKDIFNNGKCSTLLNLNIIKNIIRDGPENVVANIDNLSGNIKNTLYSTTRSYVSISKESTSLYESLWKYVYDDNMLNITGHMGKDAKQRMMQLLSGLGYYHIVKGGDVFITRNIGAYINHRSRSYVYHQFTVEKDGIGPYCGFTLSQKGCDAVSVSGGRFLTRYAFITHNTQIMQTFSEAINLPYYKINMGGSTDPSHFLGHSSTYVGSQPGVIVKALKHMKSKSGIIYLDEFDKIENNEWEGASKVSNAFLHISDPVQQKSFTDEYLSEINIDISEIMFVYSFNDADSINEILRDRIPILEVDKYTREDKKNICSKYMIGKIIANVGISDITFSDEALDYVIDMHKDEHGLRGIKHTLYNIIRKLNLIKVSGYPEGNLDLGYKFTIKFPYIITKKTFDLFEIKKDDIDISSSLYI